MPSHVAITGATGFIGSAVLKELLSSGARVTVLLRPESNAARLELMKGFETLTYSHLLDKRTLDQLKETKPDVFIHCAWRGVGGHERNEAFQITHNVPATIDSVELASAAGCRQWIGLGSHAEYGNLNRRISEDAPLLPTTVYGKAKLAAGVAALALCESRKMAGVWMRVFSTYGPGDAPHWLIPHVIQEFIAGHAPKLTQCEQLWDYLYVGDAARAVTGIANGTASGVFNLGSGFARPLREIIETIRHELSPRLQPAYGEVPYRPDQVMHLEADISRLQAATAWEPTMNLVDGIRATVLFEQTRLASRPS